MWPQHIFWCSWYYSVNSDPWLIWNAATKELVYKTTTGHVLKHIKLFLMKAFGCSRRLTYRSFKVQMNLYFRIYLLFYICFNGIPCREVSCFYNCLLYVFKKWCFNTSSIQNCSITSLSPSCWRDKSFLIYFVVWFFSRVVAVTYWTKNYSPFYELWKPTKLILIFLMNWLIFVFKEGWHKASTFYFFSL